MNVSKVLAKLGVPNAIIPVVGQVLYFCPQTTDPDTSGVRFVVRALQVGLRKLGHNAVQLSGVLDEQTARALDLVAPPVGSWRVKTWIQLLGDVNDALSDPYGQSVKLKAMSGYSSPGLGDILTDLASIGPASSFLKWGYGVSNASNCAPADAATKSVFAAVQHQANRLGAGIVEDGVIGTNTVRALQGLSAITGVMPASCSDVAGNAVLIGSRLKAEADRRGIGADAGKAIAISSERPQATIYQSKEALTPEAKSNLGVKSLMQYLPYAFIAAGAAWLVLKRKPSRAAASA